MYQSESLKYFLYFSEPGSQMEISQWSKLYLESFSGIVKWGKEEPLKNLG